MTAWTYYRLHNRRCEVVGWMRVNGTRTEYIGLCGDRWQTLDLPYAHRVYLIEAPIGFEYLGGAET